MNNNKYKITSQFGEDGIINELFGRIGYGERVCVEFGAWDGKLHSNTWNLWANENWTAVLIEGDVVKYQTLCELTSRYNNVVPINEFVTPNGVSSLDNILLRWNPTAKIDLLSIDIDGDDYHVWEGLVRYQPRVVIIEHNPTIPPEIDIVQRTGAYMGSSALALTRLAHQKGYNLAACTDTNCFFVRNEDFLKLGIKEPTIESIFPRKYLSYIINSYDGKMYLGKTPVYSEKIKELSSLLLKHALINEIQCKNSGEEVPVLGEHKLIPIKTYADTIRPIKKPMGFRLLNLFTYQIIKTLQLKKSIDTFNSWKSKRTLIKKWKKEGSPVPPPHVVKQEILKEYAKRHKKEILIETGTYLGDMVAAMIPYFKIIYSIELGKDLYEKACVRFQNNKSIRLLCGDSGEKLSSVLCELEQPAIFWLDGHYSEGITAQGDLDTPIYNELKQIFAHKVKNHVVLIDDARCFTGEGDYPTVNNLKAYIENNRPGALFNVRDDVIRIVF